MKFEFSAGGIVIKKEKESFSVLLCQHSQHHGWVFPKGLIGDTHRNESKEETAIREVKEECGVDAKIIKALTPVVYWYQFEGEKRKKTVYYFLMEYLGGDINKHDEEMEKVEWLPLSQVDDRLTYPSDKKVWHEARRLILSGY
jgi:8-oxo-dGTP pyrophosphatase MutT (NUDIX family)